MTDQHSSALEQILEAARSSLQARHAETLERAGRVRAALDAYVNALGAEIAAEFAAKNGLAAAPAGQSPIGAALALRAAVEGLPELRSRASAPVAIAPPPPPSAPAASAPIAPAPPIESSTPPPPKRTIVTTSAGTSAARRLEEHDAPHEKPRSSDLDPLTVALIRDMQSLDLARMPQHQFRIWAEELAARARALQDKGADPDSVPGRVIRKLTAIAYEKGIGDIFGLNRKHTANWDDVAERARVRREQALANASAAAEKAAQKKEAAAIEAKSKPAVPPPIESKPATPRAEEDAPTSAKVESKPKPEPEPEPDSKRQEINLLRSGSKRSPVVFVGGVVKQEKVALIQQKYGIEIEWVDTSRHGTQAIAGVEKRIRERRLTAVVVLQGLIGHKHFEPLVAAARQVGTPFAYADKAGLGSVAKAFTELEKQLGDSTAERNAV